MLLRSSAALALVGYLGLGGAEGSETRMDETSPAASLERNLKALQFEIGEGAYRAEHDRAIAWLLAHPDLAYPRLLQLIRERTWTNPNAVLSLLPRFGRAEAIPILEHLLLEEEAWLAWNAGQALGAHPMQAAREALERALGSRRAGTVIAAADALRARADHASCPGLKGAVATAEGEPRLHALSAALSMGCYDEPEIAALRHATDVAVRSLVAQWDAARKR